MPRGRPPGRRNNGTFTSDRPKPRAPLRILKPKSQTRPIESVTRKTSALRMQPHPSRTALTALNCDRLQRDSGNGQPKHTAIAVPASMEISPSVLGRPMVPPPTFSSSVHDPNATAHGQCPDMCPSAAQSTTHQRSAPSQLASNYLTINVLPQVYYGTAVNQPCNAVYSVWEAPSETGFLAERNSATSSTMPQQMVTSGDEQGGLSPAYVDYTAVEDRTVGRLPGFYGSLFSPPSQDPFEAAIATQEAESRGWYSTNIEADQDVQSDYSHLRSAPKPATPANQLPSTDEGYYSIEIQNEDWDAALSVNDDVSILQSRRYVGGEKFL